MEKISAVQLYNDLKYSHSEDQIIDNLQSLSNDGALDIKAHDGEGYTALHDSSARNHTQVAQWLIKNGADVDAKNYNGYTPLHVASSYGNTTVVQLLLDKGADVNANFGFFAPLHYATYWGDIEVAKLLLERGADVNSKDTFGKSPIDYAYGKKQFAIVKALETHIDKIYGLDNPDQYADPVFHSPLVDEVIPTAPESV